MEKSNISNILTGSWSLKTVLKLPEPQKSHLQNEDNAYFMRLSRFL